MGKSMSEDYNFLRKFKILWIGIILTFIYWILEALLHVFIFNEGTLSGQLFTPTQHEVWMRFIVISIILIFSFYAQRSVDLQKKAARTISLAHSELNQIFNTAADGMRVVDKDFNVLRINDTFSSMTGVSKREAEERKCYEIFSGEMCHTPECPLNRIIEGKDRVEVDVIKETKDGAKVPCIVTATPYRDMYGNVVGIVEDFKDITERKIAEETLRKSEEKYRLLFENSPVGIISIDKDGSIKEINSVLLEILGSPSAEETRRINMFEFPPIIEAGITKDITECLNKERKIVSERPYVSKWGKKVYLRYILTPVYDLKGNMSGVQAIVEDITDRKIAEFALKESEERWKALYKNTPVPVYVWKKQGDTFILIDYNDSARMITDGEVKNYVGKTLDEMYGDREDIIEDFWRCFKEKRVFTREMNYRFMSTVKMASFIVGYAFAPPDLILVHTQDITELKNIEAALRESEEKYRLVVENANEGMVVIQDGKVEFANPRVFEITGYSESELKSMSILDIVHPEDREMIRRDYYGRLRGEKFHQPFVLRVIDKYGDTQWIEINSVHINWRRRPAVLYFLELITGRKKAEDALRESEGKLDAMLKSISDHMCMIDREMNIIWANKTAKRVFGEDILSKKCYVVFQKKDKPCEPDSCPTMKSFNDGQTHNDTIMAIDKNGRTLYLHTTANIALIDGEGVPQAVIEISRDITEQKMVEEKIKASLVEKEALLKEIHHRVKNNLQIISSLINLQSRFINDEKIISVLRDTQNRIKSMALVHEKLYGSEDLTRIDFSEYLKSLIYHLIHSYESISRKVRLRMNVDKIYLNIDTAIPCSLIINELVSNSLQHAFPDGKEGELTIDLRKSDTSQLKLTVADNGIGFPENIDFKDTETLGLQLVVSLAKQLNGEVRFLREGGTKFEVVFSSK